MPETRRRFLAGLSGLAALAVEGWRPDAALAAQAPAAKPRIIDVHSHYAPPAWAAVVATKSAQALFGGGNPMARLKDATPAATIERMDRAGITTSIVSLTTPGIWFGAKESPIDVTRRLARECNDHGARMAADHPGRFGLFAALPLPDVDGSLRELEYALDTLKADGVGLLTHYGETYGDKLLGDAAFAPVLAELNRRKATVYVHRKIASEPYEIMGWDLHRAMLSLLTSAGGGTAGQRGGTLRYPDIHFIFSHAGGTMPFLVERSTAPTSPSVPSRAGANDWALGLGRFHYDTGHSNNTQALAALKHVVPASQILFGTDYPFSDLTEEVVGLRATGVFSPDELRQVNLDNALNLLPKYKT